MGVLGSRLLFALAAPGLGYAADVLSLQGGIAVQAVLTAALLGWLALTYRWIDPKYFVVKPPPKPSHA